MERRIVAEALLNKATARHHRGYRVRLSCTT